MRKLFLRTPVLQNTSGRLLLSSIRSSHSEVFLGKAALKIWSKLHPCRSVISIKLLCSYIEITLLHRYAPVNLLHIFRTLFTKNTSGWLLLKRANAKFFLLRIMSMFYLNPIYNTFNDKQKQYSRGVLSKRRSTNTQQIDRNLHYILFCKSVLLTHTCRINIWKHKRHMFHFYVLLSKVIFVKIFYFKLPW